MPWLTGDFDENAIEPFDETDLLRFRQAGEELVDYTAGQCFQKKISPPLSLTRRLKSEIRCGLIEVIMDRLQLPLPVDRKKQLMDSAGALFVSNFLWWDMDIEAMEPSAKWSVALSLWEQFKALVLKTENMSVNKDQIRRQIYPKLLLQT